MISNVNQLRATSKADAFQTFDVEFGSAMQGPAGLADQAVAGPSFGDVLMDALQDVTNQQTKAEKTAFDFATGKPVDVHTMMIEMAKADVLVQVTSSVVSKTATGINQLLQTQI